MAVLETYEWCNFWWEKADRADRVDRLRVLLIGDSITRGYRPGVNELLKEEAYVDMLATSKAVDNPSLKREIGYILTHEKFEYKAIHFNNGLHGFHLTAEAYEKGMEEAVCYILENCRTAKLLLALSTPVTEEGRTSSVHTDLNSKIVIRNHGVLRIAEKYGLEIDDLYAPMLGRSELRVDDGFHYNREGEAEQAKIVAEKLKRLL